MRSQPNHRLKHYRKVHPTLGESPFGVNYGYFEAQLTKGHTLRIISSGSDSESGWEHVSISLAHRTPTWKEMCFVKDLFWDEEETVIQFHPPRSKYKNDHPHTLHLWRKCGENAQLPPQECV